MVNYGQFFDHTVVDWFYAKLSVLLQNCVMICYMPCILKLANGEITTVITALYIIMCVYACAGFYQLSA